MRERVTAARLQEFMKALGDAVAVPARIFVVGGATAVLCGWRESTIDVDLKIPRDGRAILEKIPALKERFKINVELATPDDFIPALPSWEDRSRFIQEGRLTFFHYDFYAQALAKIERGHQVDLLDVEAMLRRDFIKPDRLLELYVAIEPELYKYPALNPAIFREAVERVVREGNISADD